MKQAYQETPFVTKDTLVDPLESLARLGAQRMLQAALEEEVEAYLQRARYQRKGVAQGYRSGYLPERSIILGNGAVPIKVPRVSDEPAGLRSFRDIGFDWMRSQVIQACGQAVNQPAVMARFWFHPTQPDYEEDKNCFLFKNVAVQLLTEEEHLTAGGQRIQTGQGHPSAEEFRNSFTAKYREVAREEGIYAQLRSLYRFTALAMFLKRRRVFEKTGLDIDLWLRGYRYRIFFLSIRLFISFSPNLLLSNIYTILQEAFQSKNALICRFQF